jgi:predicted nucleic acid-binding Zn ribbon protein
MSKMNKNRPSQPEISHIKELLHQIMTGVRRPGNDDIHQIQRIWDEMLGQSIARHARPVALEKGILIIHVDSSTITQQLRFQVKMMIRQINQQMGHERVMDLRFKISNA